jgi:hypothetical protein
MHENGIFQGIRRAAAVNSIELKGQFSVINNRVGVIPRLAPASTDEYQSTEKPAEMRAFLCGRASGIASV